MNPPVVDSKRCRWCQRVELAPRERARGICHLCLAEARAWVFAHREVNPRLVEAARLDLLHTLRVPYLEARLQVEQPDASRSGWKVERVETAAIHNPSLPALEALRHARTTFPDAALRFLFLRHVHRSGCGDAADTRGVKCPAVDYKGAVLVASFRGAQIVRRLEPVS